MRRPTVLLLALAVVGTASLFAQSAATNDPVTGTWGAQGMSFLELKYDGNGGVTGTAIWRHSDDPEQRTKIEKGTFDPKTGALTLEGSATNRAGESVRYVIEGKIENGTASGTFRVGDDKGEFTFTRQ
jgi:hypothetical protein